MEGGNGNRSSSFYQSRRGHGRGRGHRFPSNQSKVSSFGERGSSSTSGSSASNSVLSNRQEEDAQPSSNIVGTCPYMCPGVGEEWGCYQRGSSLIEEVVIFVDHIKLSLCIKTYLGAAFSRVSEQLSSWPLCFLGQHVSWHFLLVALWCVSCLWPHGVLFVMHLLASLIVHLVVPLTVPKKGTAYASSLDFLLACHSVDFNLERGGRYLQRHLDAQHRLIGAEKYVGACKGVIDEVNKEMIQREKLRDLAIFERLNGNPRKSSPALAVKKFCRTISTKYVQASDLRPIVVLEDTLNYLWSLLESKEHSFEEVHDFVFDRTRSWLSGNVSFIRGQGCLGTDMFMLCSILDRTIASCVKGKCSLGSV
ncbi:hypothetical protein V8G54_024095 [Vigna mungo]|uniref:SAC3/GANP/THP3 conserved domain-containing protein n=1 Tax=Vigna mungo TaxID=3915 RepID=A0AAQ3RSW4_VIGMU